MLDEQDGRPSARRSRFLTHAPLDAVNRADQSVALGALILNLRIFRCAGRMDAIVDVPHRDPALTTIRNVRTLKNVFFIHRQQVISFVKETMEILSLFLNSI